ncbi:MAG: twin-arginine translocase TatA/TatE family subunit [Acidobacteria bacterium]|nr:twin-arginine translocase TatA/TatE family subunit [Acidobacteriota bacterium]
MGQLGFGELLVIGLIALLIFGPKKLPELGKSLGKGLREFKKATEDIKSSFDEHLREAESSIEEAKQEIKETERDMKTEFYAGQTPPSQTTVPKEQV